MKGNIHSPKILSFD